MLRINGAATVDLPCIIEVDPFVPLRFETYTDGPPPARAFMIGNFRSLLEVWVDADSFLLRGVDLVIFDRILSPDEVGSANWVDELQGLPIVDPASVPHHVTEEHLDFGVALGEDTLVVAWSPTARFDQMIRYHTVQFYTVERELRRVAFCALDPSQRAMLVEHVDRRRQRGQLRE